LGSSLSKEERIVVRVGKDRFNVIAGHVLNAEPLSRIEADELARVPAAASAALDPAPEPAPPPKPAPTEPPKWTFQNTHKQRAGGHIERVGQIDEDHGPISLVVLDRHSRHPRAGQHIVLVHETKRRVATLVGRPNSHASFYHSRCLVCERDIRRDPMTGAALALSQSHRKYCGRKCKTEAARFPAHLCLGATHLPGAARAFKKCPFYRY
jgi:hypothetical protein